MTKVLKYLVMLNLCLALANLAGSAWMARTVGSQAYVAGAVAMLIVGLAASLALLLSFSQSHQKSDNAVSGVLLGMLIRMGLPLAAMVLMQQAKSPLIGAGFMGLLVLSYLVALPLETWMSLQFVHSERIPKKNT